MSLKLINGALQILHNMHGDQADELVTILRKVRTNFINEVGTVAAAAKPVVEAVKEVAETVDAAAGEAIAVLNVVDEAAKPADAVEKEAPLADVIAKKGIAKRSPGRPRVKK